MDSNVSYSDSFAQRDALMRHMQYVAGGLGIFNAVCILLTNSVLVFIISTTKTLRQSFFNQIILSVAVCNWMLGAVWSPMKIDYMFSRKWRFGCWMHIAFQLYEGYIQVFVTTWLLIIYNTCHIMEIAQIQSPTIPRKKLLALKLVILAAPWLFGVIIILPMSIGSLHPLWNQSVWTATYCPVILSSWSRVIVPCLCFFLPATILMLQCAYIFVKCRRSRAMTSLNNASSSSVIAASLITVLMTLDEEIFYMTMSFVIYEHTTVMIQWLVSQFFADFQKAALPLVWILSRDIKEELRMKLKLRLRGRYVADSSVEVTYYRNYATD